MAKTLAKHKPVRARHARGRTFAPDLAQRLTFKGVTGTVQFNGPTGLSEVLQKVVLDWPCAVTKTSQSAPSGASLLCQISAKPAGLTIRSRYVNSPLTGMSVTSAICALVADLSQGYVDSDPDLAALHCGAVQINGQLIVLTGQHRAGKSTLIARLLAEPDMRVFCDDVLPISPDGQGISLGIAPRLRLPLPETAAPVFRSHVAKWCQSQDGRYAYVCAPGRAAFGTRAPLSAILLLDRRDAGPARLHHMPTDTALKHMFSRNLADLGTAEAAFEKMHRLVTGLTCLRLVYSDLEDAVTLLRAAFTGPDAVSAKVSIAPDCGDDVAPRPAPAPVDPATSFCQNPAVAIRRVGQSHFLWMPGDSMLWQLNPLGGAIWTLLEIPGSAADLTETLAEVFPDQPKGGILADTAQLLTHLAAEGMILPSDISA